MQEILGQSLVAESHSSMQGRDLLDNGSNWEDILDQVLALGLTSGASRDQRLQILTRRFGLVSGKVETLEAIGQDLGITRERVRQIESKAMARIHQGVDNQLLLPVNTFHAMISLIQQEVDEKGGLLGRDDVLALLGKAGTATRYCEDTGVPFLLRISRLLVEPVRNAENHWVVCGSKTVASDFQRAADLIHDFLQERGPMEEQNLYHHIQKRQVPPGVALAAVRVDPGVTVSENYVWLVDCPKWHYVLASVRQLALPSHFSNIAEQVNLLLPEGDGMSQHAVHAMLGHHEPKIFRRVGLGTFGLAEWGLPAVKDSVDLVCQILEGKLSWLTFQEISLMAKSHGWQVKPESIRAAMEIEIVGKYRRLRKVGTGESAKFGLSWWHDPQV